MEVKNQKFIQLAVFCLAYQITSISKANNTAVKHVTYAAIRQKHTSRKTQKN